MTAVRAVLLSLVTTALAVPGILGVPSLPGGAVGGEAGGTKCPPARGTVHALSYASAAEDDLRELRTGDRAARVAALRSIAQGDPAALRPRITTLRPLLRDLLSKEKDAEIRGLAAAAWLRADGDVAVKSVIDAMRTERDPVAESLLAEAWSRVSGDVARRALATAVADRTDERLGALAAEALGWLGRSGDAEGRDDITGILAAAPSWPIASGACLGLGRMQGPREILVASVELLLRHLRHPDPSVRACAAAALGDVTGQDLGPAAADWEAWWAKERATWTPPAPRKDDAPPAVPAAPAASGTSDRAGDANRRTWSRFFGIEVKGRRVAFAIDYSQSMWGERRARAEKELVEAVKGLPPSAQVSVLLFNEREWWWRETPVPARPQEKLDLVRYLPEQETKSYTNIYDSLEEALGLAGLGAEARRPAPGLDEILLLSDGVPNRGKLQDEDRIVDAIEILAAGRVRISTVSLGPPPTDDRATKLLERLALVTGGKYVNQPIAK